MPLPSLLQLSYKFMSINNASVFVYWSVRCVDGCFLHSLCANVCAALILVFPLTISPTSSPVPLYLHTTITNLTLFIYLFYILSLLQSISWLSYLSLSSSSSSHPSVHSLTHLLWFAVTVPAPPSLLHYHLALLFPSPDPSLSHSALCLALSGWAAPRWPRVCVHSGACRASPPPGLTTRFCLSPLNSTALPSLPLSPDHCPTLHCATPLNSSCHFCADCTVTTPSPFVVLSGSLEAQCLKFFSGVHHFTVD